MLQTLIRRSAAAGKPPVPFNIHTNPYKAKREWPPDFTKLSQKHQFRMERRYRRRAKLKWARPRWTKFTKLAQWGSVLFVLGYGVLFMPVGPDGSPFDSIRAWYAGLADSLWSKSSTQPISDSPRSVAASDGVSNQSQRT